MFFFPVELVEMMRKILVVKRRRGFGEMPGDDDDVDFVVRNEEFERQEVEIRLPEWRVLRLAARSVLLLVFLLSFPWISTRPVFRGANAGNASGPTTINSGAVGGVRMDDVFFLPMLFRDLKGEGIFRPGTDKAVFLGRDGNLRLPFLKRNELDLVDEQRRSSIASNSVDFVFAADGIQDSASSSAFIDRVVKPGGIAIIHFDTDFSSEFFRLPPYYIPIYIRIRRFGSTVVAMRKTSGALNTPSTATAIPVRSTGRKLLTVPESKKAAPNGLEEALLEPPRSSSKKNLKRTKYFPDLTGDTLDAYPRRVFVDVAPSNSKNDEAWFTRNYPTRKREFEIIRVEMAKDSSAEEVEGWLWRNVREEEYVVMKAEAEVMEELIRTGADALVDELFMECKHQWQKEKGHDGGGGGRRRAYWECLALYGRLRDEGVAVHQWWS